MKVFDWSGMGRLDGYYANGIVIVVAEDVDVARQMVRDEFYKRSLSDFQTLVMSGYLDCATATARARKNTVALDDYFLLMDPRVHELPFVFYQEVVN